MPHTGIMRVTRQALIGALVAAATAGTLAVAAPGMAPSASGVSLEVDNARVPAGEVLVVRGHGFPHDVHVALRAGRADERTERIGGARTGRRGSFVAEVRIDPDAPAGRYVVVACHDRCRVKAAVRFRVRRP